MKRDPRNRSSLSLSLLWLACVGCEPGGPSVGQLDSRAQPGVTVLPLQSANLASPGSSAALRTDGGLATDAALPPPKPFEAYQQLRRDSLGAEELDGLTLQAHWRRTNSGPWPEPPAEQKPTVERLRRETSARWTVQIAAIGRLRAEIASRGQSLPRGSVLSARIDRYGSVLTWPDGKGYRLLPPGTLHNTIGDRRADVTQLAPGKIEVGASGTRLGMPTRSVRIRSSMSDVRLEFATVQQAGRGALLFCRMVLEIAGVEPSSPACAGQELLLGATMQWATDGESAGDSGLVLEVTGLQLEEKLGSQTMRVPPSRARFVTSGLPGADSTLFLNDSELLALGRDANEQAPRTDEEAPSEGLVAHNQSDRLVFLLIDGVVVASVPPWRSLAIPGLKKGAYTAQWLPFLGEATPAATPVTLPTHFVFGAAQGQNPDAG